MSEWIKLYSSAFTHPKTRRVAKRLGVSPAAAVGHMAALWSFTAEFAPDGDLSRFDVEELELAAGWDGEDGAFVEAAQVSGYLDDDGGALSVHDWSDYGGKLAERRAVDRKRKADARKSSGSPSDIQRTSSGQPRARASSASAGQREEREEREEIEEKEQDQELRAQGALVSVKADDPPVDNSSAGDPAAYSDDFEAFWAAYPRKEEKRKAWRAWNARLKKQVAVEDMATAAGNYAAGCKGAERRFIKLPATFIGPDMPFTDWVSGTPAGCVPSNGRGLSAAEMWAELNAEARP